MAEVSNPNTTPVIREIPLESTATGDQVVPGFLFYSYTKSRAVSAARMAAESVLEELEDTLEDSLG